MLNKIINFSIKNKLIAILLTISIAGFGVFAIVQIPLGAVPDITNNQVQVITTSTSLSTQDVEQFITYPVELEMSNLPGVTEIRSISKFGLSVVTIVFEDKMGTYLPRQLIAEKIKAAADNIPEGFGTPEMGPISTGLGEIYQYILDTKPGFEDRYSITELRTLQDWVVKRQLSGIPGVVEINTWGGYLKQYEVAINPEQLKSMNLTLLEVFRAVEKNNSVAGGAYIEKENESYFIRGDGLVGSLEDIENIVVRNKGMVPVLIRDLADVRFGSANRFGAITANGEGEKVMGQIMMLKDANSNKVIKAVKERVDEVQKTLPEGIFINPVVERSELIKKTSFTVFENLLFGCLIVFLTVVLLLGNLRSGLVIASLIPLSLLFTISMMYLFGIDANLMSLGALDFGIIIDGAVIIVEFIAVRLTLKKSELAVSRGAEKQSLMDRITYSGASKMINSAIFGQVIILIVFIPVLSLSGVEGKMFRPMALSFSFALLGAIFFGLIWLPAASAIFLRPEKEKTFVLTKWIMKLLHRSYDPVIRWAYDHKGVIFGLAIASLIGTGYIFSKMGGEFVPTLDEGDFVIQPVLKTGTSLSKTIKMTTRMEQILIDQFPEVNQIVCRIGAAEVPTDPMSMEEIDMIIKLRPKKDWVSAESKEELANRFKEALMIIPGIDYEFTQPIEMRFNELITGVRADLAIKIFGEDLNLLADKAQEVKKLIVGVPGAADIIIEKTEGLPQMSVKYHRNKLALYGLSVEDLNNYLGMAFGGRVAGNVFEGEKRFDLAVRFLPEFRSDIEHIQNLYVGLSNGEQVPLSELAEISYSTGPAKISRDNTHRRVVVSVNVRNRDLESVVSDIEILINDKLDLPSGYYIDYGGQFENLNNASRRLKYAVPIALLLIFIFLHFAFKSFKEAALIFTAIPLSVVGGVFLLWIRGMPFSISAGIGFIALFGIAVLNGIVLIEHLKDLKKLGVNDMRERILKGTSERLRPVLLTASAAALGFLPMAISSSAGAEVQRPLATVVIGGLFTSTLLTMLALPLMYAVFDDITGIRIFPPGFKRKGMLPILLLFIFPAFLNAQNAESPHSVQELSIEEVLQIAYNNNRELAAYAARAEESKALINSAFEIDRTNIYYNYDENNIAENNYPIGVVGGSQHFDFPSTYFTKRKVYRASADMASEDFEKKKKSLSREVSLAYYRTIYLKNRLDKIHYLSKEYSRYADAARISHETGESSYLEMLMAISKQEQAQINLLQADNEMENAREELAALMFYDSAFRVPDMSLPRLMYVSPSLESDPGYRYYKSMEAREKMLFKLFRQDYLPDINLEYFNGSNNYAGSGNYQGFEIGIGIPLFFADKRSKVKASKYSLEASTHLLQNFKNVYQSKFDSLTKTLKSHDASVEYYEQTGRELALELLRTAEKSYELGEIDFFSFVQGVDRAIEMELDYLKQLFLYDKTVLEIKYMSLN